MIEIDGKQVNIEESIKDSNISIRVFSALLLSIIRIERKEQRKLNYIASFISTIIWLAFAAALWHFWQIPIEHTLIVAILFYAIYGV